MRIALDNRRIDAMTRDPALVAAFPFLTATAAQPACCGRGGRLGPAYEQIRKAIASLSATDKAKFKAALKVDEILVYWQDGPRIQRITF